jgi:alpha-galactosidase
MKKLFLLLLISPILGYSQKFDHLALTPPMGWNSWNTFATEINEKLILETADILTSNGMKDEGYSYLVLDDAWMAHDRDAQGNLVADPIKFPHGMKFVSDYIHSKGLKFGLYNCAGTKTCAGYPGTRGYEYQDALFYAAQGIDYLKFDWCYSEGINAREAYKTMSKALKKAGRPVVFSLCEWGTNKPWEWADSIGHLWRTTGDISNQYEGTKNNGTWSSNGVMHIVDLQADLRKFAGPGHWNDPDMLEVGNGMKAAEDRTHFSLWCMMAAPLILGNDLRKMSPETLSILTNKEAISIDQDVLGIQGYRNSSVQGLETWIKPLANNELAIGFVNRTENPISIQYDWAKNPVQDDLSKTFIDFTKDTYTLTGVWEKIPKMNTKKTFKGVVGGHDIILILLKKSN